MKLKSKWVKFKSGGPLIVLIHKNDAISLNIKPLDRVKLTIRKKEITASTDIVSDNGIIKPGKILLKAK